MTNFNYRKATQSLNYIASKLGGKADTLTAIKFIWLADRLHLRLYGRMITNDEYFAMKLGPVASGTYNLIKRDAEYLDPEALEYFSKFLAVTDVRHNHFLSCQEVDTKVFSKTDLKVIDEVLEKFSNMTKWQLSDYSHLFDEWTRYKDDLEKNPRGNFKINTDDFFNETPFGDSVFNQGADTLECVKQMYSEDNP